MKLAQIALAAALGLLAGTLIGFNLGIYVAAH